MSKPFNEKIKEVKEFTGSNWFSFGVHKVKIDGITYGETDSGAEFIEAALLGENGEEETVRSWFTTEKGANYSFNIWRSIFVHNAPEAKKQKAGLEVDATTDAENLAEFLQTLVGTGECWFTKYESPDRTYLNGAGETKHSIDKSIYGYEPKLREDLLGDGQAPAKATDFPVGEKASDDATANIPKDWK